MAINGLLAYFAGEERVVVVEDQAAGVDQLEFFAEEFGGAVGSVAGDARFVRYDCSSTLCSSNPIDQRTLSNIRSSDDSNQRDRFVSSCPAYRF